MRTVSKQYKIEYTNNITRKVCERIIKANSEDDAKLWFENHLDNDNLLDGVWEVD